MLSNRQLFLQYVGQTSPSPLGLEIERAEGIYLYDKIGKSFVDFISGISVSNVGHRHPIVLAAIHAQLDKYMHLMVYGEYVQSPQVMLAQRIASLLPDSLNAVYFTNSGAEAIEAALKLAKRITKRSELISYRNSYHGSTHGALSVMGSEFFKTSFRPLLPDTRLLDYNDIDQLQHITAKTAAVVIEPVQAEAGIIVPDNDYLIALRKRCDETGTLLIMDEIQTGFGRTGKLFGFEHSGVIPDIICFAKGMGGGMPIGAMVSSRDNLSAFTENPVLGHITTFGGHPVSCAAALACIDIIVANELPKAAARRQHLFKEYLQHNSIKEVRGIGLMHAVLFDSYEVNKKVIDALLEKGIITDWFLFCDYGLRIGPPLTITDDELIRTLETMRDVMKHI
jgi:acetylornithine/N-succinyldiaminopimelate aminotransferase